MDSTPPSSVTVRRPWIAPQVWVPPLLAAFAALGLSYPVLLVLWIVFAAGASEGAPTWLSLLATGGLVVLTAALAAGASVMALTVRHLRRPLQLSVDDTQLWIALGEGAPRPVPRVGLQIHWRGSYLVLGSDDGSDRVRVPGGPDEREAVQAFLDGHGLARAALPAPGSDDVLALAEPVATHEGVTWQLDPVHQPMPVELLAILGMMAALAGWLGIGLLVAPVVATLIDATGVSAELAYAVGALVSLVPAVAAVGAWVYYEVGVRVIGVQVRVTGQRVQAESRTQLGARRWSTALADVRDVSVVGRSLVVQTVDEAHRIPLMGRSQRTREALEAVVRGQKAQLTDGGGREDVPAPLNALLSRLTEPS